MTRAERGREPRKRRHLVMTVVLVVTSGLMLWSMGLLYDRGADRNHGSWISGLFDDDPWTPGDGKWETDAANKEYDLGADDYDIGAGEEEEEEEEETDD